MEQGKFDVLFNQYYERLVLFAESYVGDLETAEDMVQDVFLSLLSRSDFNEVEYSRSYLYSCVRNGCVDYLRKLKVIDPLDIKLFDAVYYAGDFGTRGVNSEGGRRDREVAGTTSGNTENECLQGNELSVNSRSDRFVSKYD